MSIAATVGLPIITGIPACIHDGFVALEKLNGVDKTYLLYVLKASESELRSAGQTGSQSNVNTTIVNGLSIALPPLPEQERIAQALSDVDSLISSLKHLVTKKQSIKQGMMQELLTGKTRLPGFTDEWQWTDIAPVSTVKARIGWQGLKTGEYLESGDFRLVGGTDFIDGKVNWSKTPFVDEWRYTQDPFIQLRVGDVLLTKDGSIGKVAFVDSLPGPATLNSGVFVIRPRIGAYDPEFMYFMLRSRMFDEFVAKLTAGSTISHLYQRDLVTLRLLIPQSIDEQRSIARCLRDADDEINMIRVQLQQARLLKQGMMQELLSGRTRLTTGGPAE